MGRYLAICLARASFASAFLITLFAMGWKFLPACRRAVASVGIRKFLAALQKNPLENFISAGSPILLSPFAYDKLSAFGQLSPLKS